MAFVDPRPPTRKELELVFKNPRLVRAIEKIFELIPSELNEITKEITIIKEVVSISLATSVHQSLDSINRLTNILETLAMAPVPVSEYPVLDYLKLLEQAPAPAPAPLIDSNLTVRDTLILSKNDNHGIKVDKVNPTYGWRDLLGRVSIRGVGASDPNFVIYQGSYRAFEYRVGDESFMEFHIPHDYVIGTDVFLHFHWSLNVGSVAETITWGADLSYAKGHNQAAFTSEILVTVGEVSNTTARQHMLTEVQITGVGLLTAADLEMDGVILCRAFLSANTGSTRPFLHFVDVHYQSTNIGTKQKEPDFYV